jgi:hypothetical protein
MAPSNPQGDTYALPQVAGDGTVYTTLTNFTNHLTVASIILDRSTDGGVTWETVSTVASNIAAPPASYPNTNFRDGIENTFAVGRVAVNGVYPLYVSWEDYSTKFGNLQISASYDGGVTWSAPVKVNDNPVDTDAFQPNLAVAASGKVLVAFYDRRLKCPALGDTDAKPAGLDIDANHPYGAVNYCVNASLQVFNATLGKVGQNIRLSKHTWDPQLNSMKPSGISRPRGFIGDYFGIDTAPTVGTTGTTVFTTSVSTFSENGNNPNHYQQQVVASLTIP